MTEATLYERQQSLGLTIPKSATVVGAGGTGSWVALFLAMSGVPNLFLYDADKVELSNLNRLPLSPQVVALPKVEAMKALITSLRPDIYLEVFGKADVISLEEVEHGVVFDCTDRHSTQLFLSKWTKERGITYIRVGYDGTHVTVTDVIPSWSTSEADEAGYTNEASWVVPAALAACLGVVKLMYAPVEVNHDISDVYQRAADRPGGGQGNPPPSGLTVEMSISRLAEQEFPMYPEPPEILEEDEDDDDSED